jgi:hypothetical protein
MKPFHSLCCRLGSAWKSFCIVLMGCIAESGRFRNRLIKVKKRHTIASRRRPGLQSPSAQEEAAPEAMVGRIN